MSSQKRRDFLKKSLAGSLLLGAGFSRSTFGNRLPTGPFFSQNWRHLRQAFPLSRKRHFMNTASLGPSPQVVIDMVTEAMQRLEERAQTGRQETYATHERLGKLLHVAPEDLAITRNATEGANIAARSLPLQAGDEIILTDQEHVGGAAPWIALQESLGVRVKLVRLDLSGAENYERIADAITPKTRVLAFSHVTCTTGLVLPAKELVQLCRERGIYSSIDGAQAMGMIPLDLQDMQPDFYFSSGHKWLFGPKGTGVLYIHPETIKSIHPTFVGAYTDKAFNLESLKQEYLMVAQREEYGTRNTPITLGLGAAVEFINELGQERVAARGRELCQYLRAGLNEIEQVTILTPESAEYSASILTFQVKGRSYAEVKEYLISEYQLIIRGIYEANLNALRVSLAVFNSEAECDRLVHGLKAYLAS